MTLLPDFDTYPIDSTLRSAHIHAAWVELTWSDGHVSRFHHVWLRDNCPCAGCVAQSTKEQTFELLSVPEDVVPSGASIDDEGALALTWSNDGHASAYHLGWLRAHCYSSTERSARRPAASPWDATTWSAPPSFDAAAVLADDAALHEWLVALRDHGATRVRGLDCSDDALAQLVARIGVIRETNFGVVWDVRNDPDPVSNAYTSLALPPHVDLPTREHQPGLQFLHCLANEAEGGDSVLVDGLRVAEVLRDEHPAEYATATTTQWSWANRARTSDHRWRSPLIVTDGDGRVTEIRAGNWLRGPLDVPFDQVEAAYRAYRRFFEISYRADLQVRFRLEPGDVMAFDNRRVLHGRTEFSDARGRRHLRGCYSEREELQSRLRILERAARAAAVDADVRGG
jgi:gamma-butyrobetaine dioxygenase